MEIKYLTDFLGVKAFMNRKSSMDIYDPNNFELINITEKEVHFSENNTRLVVFFYLNEKQELIAIEFQEAIMDWGTHIDIYNGNRNDERWIAHERIWKKFKNHKKFSNKINF